MSGPLPTKMLRTNGFPGLPTSRIVFALMVREMVSTYGKSVGGFFWVILEPVIGIALMTGIFALAFRSPPLGTSFPLFYATGVVPFLIFVDINSKLAHSIKFSRQLLSYPVITFFDALLARFILNFLAQLMVAYLVFLTIVIFFADRVAVDFESISLCFAMIAAIGFGIGSANCFLFNFFPVWERIWAIVMRPMFLISCIFYLFDDVPEPYQSVLWFNPVIHLVGALRDGIFSTYDAEYVSPLYIFGLSLGLTAFAFVMLNRYFMDFRN